MHGRINRREFLDHAALFALGGFSACALLVALSPNYAQAEPVEFTAPDILAEYITYPSPKGHGQVRGYLARPAKATGKVPAVFHNDPTPRHDEAAAKLAWRRTLDWFGRYLAS